MSDPEDVSYAPLPHHEPGDGGHRPRNTAQFERIDERLREIDGTAKRWKWWLWVIGLIVFGLVSGTAAVVMWMGSLASAATVKAQGDRLVGVEANVKVAHEEAVSAHTDATMAHQDSQWLMRQILNLSKAVRADVEPLPVHEQQNLKPHP